MEDIRPLKPPIEFFSPNWILFLLLLTAVIAALWFYLRRRKRGEQFVSAGPPKPAHQLALEELEKLARSEFNYESSAKIFYIKLSDIIRKYLEQRFRIFALERTTDEITRELKKTDIKTQVLPDIRLLLEDADLVKFARFKPTNDQMEESLKLAMSIVEKTKPEVNYKFQ